MLSLIVARARNGAIGKGNEIPWHAPEDLKFFARETRGGAIVMGRNTWDSLPFKPLKDRMNIVITSRDIAAEHCVSTVQGALDLARDAGYARLYGIGGHGIYSAMLPLADRLLITQVDIDVPDADVFFPQMEAAQWELVQSQVLRRDAPACTVMEYLRKR